MNINDGLYLATAILSLVCIIFRLYKKYRRTVQYSIITLVLWNLFITGLVSVLAPIIIEHNPSSIWLVNEIESIIYFVLHTLLTPLFCMYVMLINGAAKNRTKKFYVIYWIPLALAELLILLTPMFHLVFMHDQDGIYHRQWGVIVLYAVAAIYYAYAIRSLAKTWEILKNRYMRGFHIFLILVVVGIIVQAFFPMLEIECFLETISLIGILLTFDSNDGLIDMPTKLPNQISYKLNVSLYERYGCRYSVINIRFLNLSYYEHLLPENLLERLINYIIKSLEEFAPRSELYRYDFDTFILIVDERKQTKEIVGKIKKHFEKLLKADTYRIEFRTIISVAKVPEELESPKLSFQLAEYRPRKVNHQMTVLQGKNLNFIRRSGLVEEAIYRAIQAKSFEVYYQPIWDKSTQKIISCEALCRLKDEKLGPIGSEEFIPISEQNGSIVSISTIVFEKVCKDIKEWDFKSLGIKYVEVNLSLFQLMSKGLAECYKSILEKYDVPASMINLEITESSTPAESPEFSNVMDKLTEIGFSFSLDDYGTGYSNITNIMAVKYLSIKMDASILWKSSLDNDTKILLESTIKTFRSLGYNIIQEGVETKEQLDFVTSAGANLIQGFYFSKAMPRADFIEYVKNFHQ